MTNDTQAPAAAPQPPLPTGFTPEDLQTLAQQDLAVSAAFAKVVTLLMRAPQRRLQPLADLEWLALPPVLLGQFAFLDVTLPELQVPIPMGVALWASVSPEVDMALSRNLDSPFKLAPKEWNSGPLLWVIEAVGDDRVMPALFSRLQAEPFAGRSAKMRVKSQDGRTLVATLQAPQHPSA